jgi:hypothetical protein
MLICLAAFAYCTDLLEIDPANANLRATHKREQGCLIEARDSLSILCFEEESKEDVMKE